MSNYLITIKLMLAGMFILGTPCLLLFQIALIFGPVGFWQLIAFTIIALVVYVPLVIILWVIFCLIVALFGIK